MLSCHLTTNFLWKNFISDLYVYDLNVFRLLCFSAFMLFDLNVCRHKHSLPLSHHFTADIFSTDFFFFTIAPPEQRKHLLLSLFPFSLSLSLSHTHTHSLLSNKFVSLPLFCWKRFNYLSFFFSSISLSQTFTHSTLSTFLVRIWLAASSFGFFSCSSRVSCVEEMSVERTRERERDGVCECVCVWARARAKWLKKLK